MTQNRSAALVFRWSVVAIFVLQASGFRAPAQPAQITTSMAGVYNGSYASARGPVKFKLKLTQEDDGKLQPPGWLAGTFTVYLPEASRTQAYTCSVNGRYSPTNRSVQLWHVGGWQTPPPDGVVMTGLNGVFNPAGGNGVGQISGRMQGSGENFQAVRDAAELAGMAAAANPAATPVAVRDLNSPTAFDGVYAGTYGSNPDDNVPAILYVKFVDDGSVNGILKGLLSFDVSPSAGAKPVTYTYKLIGVGRSHLFWSVQPVGKPAPDSYGLTALSLGFAESPSLVYNSQGNLQRSYNPDRLSGRAVGRNGLPSHNKIEAARGKDEPSKLAGLMAAAEASASRGRGVHHGATVASRRVTVAETKLLNR